MGELVSAVVCTRNRPHQLADAVAALLEGSAREIEVIVVDQGDGPEAQIALEPWRADPRLHYLRSRTRGKGAGFNEALGRVRGAVMVCTDDDCRPPPGWVGDMARELESRPEAAIVFCNVAPVPHDPRLGYVPAYQMSRSRRLRAVRHMCGGLGIGAGMAVRRDFVTSIGGFDECFGPGGRFPSADEWDLAMRALLKGYEVYETPALTVVHDGFRTFEEGKAHASRDWVALGAVCVKPLRAGHWEAMVVGAWLFLSRAVWPPVVDLMSLRRPRGLGRVSAFMRGFASGAAIPVDKVQLRYRAHQ